LEELNLQKKKEEYYITNNNKKYSKKIRLRKPLQNFRVVRVEKGFRV